MSRRGISSSRRGNILPLVAISLIALIAMVALAVDLGLVLVARTQCQAAADAGALAGVRTLNGDADNNNNYDNAKSTAEAAVKANSVLNDPLSNPTSTDITVWVGSYSYDEAQGKFVHSRDSRPTAQDNWSAVQVQVSNQHRTYFAAIFGLDNFSSNALATSVHRPRDISIVLDFSGSMAFGSWFHKPLFNDVTGSLNPDPDYPQFGPWSVYSSRLFGTSGYDAGNTGYLGLNNFTAYSNQSGPAIVKDFFYDQTNSSPVNPGGLQNAFFTQTDPNTTWDSTATIAQPAPSNFKTQADTPIAYSGDKWPRVNRSFTSGNYAKSVQDFLHGTYAAVPNDHGVDNTPGSTDVEYLFQQKNNNPYNPSTPLEGGYSEFSGVSFKGYSMGPGYYGKTFWMWPPDPRWISGDRRQSLDWRYRFFGTRDNNALFDASGAFRTSNITSQTYTEILHWLKNTGPKVFPPNLRAGRVLYYSSIPNSINGNGGTLDEVFWKQYIDYVLGNVTNADRTLYGLPSDVWNGAVSANISAQNSLTAMSPQVPMYMDYDDVPQSPLLHFWFGPLSMLDFLAGGSNKNYGGKGNWLPGTCHEAQCWQLKAAINSALSDIEINHPNDNASLIFFSSSNAYGTARVDLGRDYSTMKNVLFFPFSLRNELGDLTKEIRPYDINWNSKSAGEIPNSMGGTAPEMALKVAYNQFSGDPPYKGRKGSTKVVLFETDGVPNTTGAGNFNNKGPHKSVFTSVGVGSGMGDGNPTVIDRAKNVVKRVSASDNDPGDPDYPGYSGATPARVHAIGFGDLFESASPAKTQALSFLLEVQKAGKTSPASAGSIENYKVITGTYQTRIDSLRECLERILQSGIQVSLIRGQGE